MTVYYARRAGEVRVFLDRAECKRFIRREGDASRLWSFAAKIRKA